MSARQTEAQRAAARRWDAARRMASRLAGASPALAEDFRRDLDVALAAVIARWQTRGTS